LRLPVWLGNAARGNYLLFYEDLVSETRGKMSVRRKGEGKRRSFGRRDFEGLRGFHLFEVSAFFMGERSTTRGGG